MHPCLRAHAKQARKCAGAVWALQNHKFWHNSDVACAAKGGMGAPLASLVSL